VGEGCEIILEIGLRAFAIAREPPLSRDPHGTGGSRHQGSNPMAQRLRNQAEIRRLAQDLKISSI
jgi:hypothetical protein